MPSTTALDERVRVVAEQLLRQWVEDSKLLLQKRENTGKLLRSLAVEAQGAAAGVVAFEVTFPGYGRILDMKATQGGKLGAAAIQNIKDWVTKEGLSKFVAGYRKRYGKVPTDQERMLTSIAWGIAKKAGRGEKRRLRWYSRRKSGMLAELYDKVATATLDDAAAAIKPSPTNT